MSYLGPACSSAPPGEAARRPAGCSSAVIAAPAADSPICHTLPPPPVGGHTPRDNERVHNGGVSFWWQQVGLPTPDDRLTGDATCDVAIVGGGLTGLWTAYYL